MMNFYKITAWGLSTCALLAGDAWSLTAIFGLLSAASDASVAMGFGGLLLMVFINLVFVKGMFDAFND